VHKIFFIAQKEFYHIRRDLRSLIIVLVMPIMMTFLYGYAINLDVENVDLAVMNYDKTFLSRELIGDFFNSTYFTPVPVSHDYEDPENLLRSGKAAAILTIRSGFADALENRKNFELGMLVDGSDVALASAVQGYSNSVVSKFLLGRLPAGADLPGISLSVQVKYNPDLKSAHFFVPALVAIILLMISALLTSITIAREKETGTMEQLLTAPVKTREILIGKLLPYVLIAFIDGIIVLLFAVLVFGVPFEGSMLLLLLFGLIYVISALSIGILISSLVNTQQVAMIIAMMTTMLPSVMLSGFIFSIKNMPLLLQWLSYIIPAKYFVVIIRGILLKGAGPSVLGIQAVALVLLAVALLTIAGNRFKTTVG